MVHAASGVGEPLSSVTAMFIAGADVGDVDGDDVANVGGVDDVAGDADDVGSNVDGCVHDWFTPTTSMLILPFEFRSLTVPTLDMQFTLHSR